jgi:superfamily I DNA/RNA helicase
LIIEVKGGGIEFDAGNHVYYSTNRHGEKNEINDPFSQARRSKYALRYRLGEADTTSGYKYPLGHAVAFPDIYVEQDLGVDASPEIILDAARLHRVKQWVIDAFRHYGMGKAPPGEQAIEALVGLLGRSWQIKVPIGTELDREESIIRTLTEQQFTVLDVLGSHRRALISGCAGSGKTMLAVEKARRLASSGYSVLLTCFNKNLEAWLKSQLRDQPNVTVHRFLSLCAVLLEQAGKPLEKSPAESDEAFYARFPDALLDGIPEIEQRFDAIIVDEGQDFSEEMWAALTSLLHDPDAGTLYIFFDDNQRLYHTEGAFPITTPPFHLNRNCRTTQEIHKAVSMFHQSDVPSECIGPEGRKPHALEVPEGANERRCIEEHIRHLVEDEKVEPGEIAILTRRSRERSAWNQPFDYPTWSATWDLSDCAAKVICSTIHAFKGLERPVVIVCELQGIDVTSDVELLYVAFSRAREHLVVVGAGQLSG